MGFTTDQKVFKHLDYFCKKIVPKNSKKSPNLVTLSISYFAKRCKQVKPIHAKKWCYMCWGTSSPFV